MSLLRNLAEALFPCRCHMCHNPVSSNEGICQFCLSDFPFISLEQPNLLFQPDIARMFNLPYCHGLLACTWYQDAMKQWLSEFKFTKQSHYQTAINAVIATQLTHFESTSTFSPDVYIILPLHKNRLIDRGFNQVAQTWLNHLPHTKVSTNTLIRINVTKAQSGLNLKQRKKNVNRAFKAKQNLQGMKVAIIDDVITTGATINAAAKACYTAGAKEIWAYATALTPLHSQSVTKK